MKVEVACGRCGRRYLVEDANIPAQGLARQCHGCGTTILVPPPRHRETPPARAAPDAPEPRAAAAQPQDSSAQRSEPPTSVVCPRCGLHFSPKSARTNGEASQARPRVLVLEDMDFFLDIARRALEPRCQVVPARTLDEARRLLARGGIDLLLLDVAVGGEEDGLVLLRELSSKPCPILIFTACDESEMYGEAWQELRALGADDVLVKGMNIEETLARKAGSLLGDPPEEAHRR